MIADQLPDYLVADITNLEASENTPIRTKSLPVNFPLSKEDKREIKLLSDKFDNEGESIAGLAAPQIGIKKQIFVFSLPERIAKIKKCQAYPKTIFINPSYTKVNSVMVEEYEKCYSVKDMVGPVERYKSIYYKAQDMCGVIVEGVAVGYPARIIQHEIDHLDGKLFIDLVPKGLLMTFDEYVRKFSKNKT